ncbi:hypothetical protein CLOM_g2774, partial [Closterium sp. NIES-68]
LEWEDSNSSNGSSGKGNSRRDATAPTDGGEVKEIGSCPTCLETKFSKFPFNSATGPSKTPLALVHMDVVGPQEPLPSQAAAIS